MIRGFTLYGDRRDTDDVRGVVRTKVHLDMGFEAAGADKMRFGALSHLRKRVLIEATVTQNFVFWSGHSGLEGFVGVGGEWQVVRVSGEKSLAFSTRRQR